MDVQFVNPLEDETWERVARTHPDYTLFHSAAWARVVFKTYKHKPLVAKLTDGGTVRAVMPFVDVRSPLTGNRGVCLPYSDFCKPLVFGGVHADALLPAMHALMRARKWQYFEIRGEHPFSSEAVPSASFYGHVLDLSVGEEALLAGFKGPVRSSLRKAERGGLEVEIRRDREAVLKFFELHTVTRKRIGLPPQPVSFFLNIHRELLECGSGSIVFVRHAGEVVAGAFLLHHGSWALYKFGASDKRLQQMRLNNLVFWEVFRFLAAQGVQKLSFGRTDMNNEGLRRFKLGWGTVEEEISYYRFTPNGEFAKPIFNRSKGAHKAVFGRLPLAVNRLAGALIYPHLD